MPERQELTFASTVGGGTSIRATLDRPSGGGDTRRPAAVIHRGIVSTEADNDVLEALAVALAEAGIIVMRFEPRTAGLILDDFHAFTLENDRDDLLAAVQMVTARSDVDARRVGLIGWWLGAMAASAASRTSASLARLCLINPATPSYVLDCLERTNGSSKSLQPEHVPHAFAAALESADSAVDAAANEQPTLIVHAAADRAVPTTVSLEYLQALERANRPVERVLIARADHAFGEPAVRQACIERVARFFAQPAASKRMNAAVGVGA